MNFIADTLLLSGALGAGFYCWMLGRRLRHFTDLEHGVGGAVAVLSVQVDDLSKALTLAQNSAKGAISTIEDVNQRGEQTAQRLELLLGSMHDLPQSPPPKPPSNPFFVRQAEQGEQAS